MKIVITKFPEIPEDLHMEMGQTLLTLFHSFGLVQDGMRVTFVYDDDDDEKTLAKIEQAILELNGGFAGQKFTWGNLTERARDLLAALREQKVAL